MFCSKSKDVLLQAGPADCWVGILRSAAAPSRPAAGRGTPPPRRSRRAPRQSLAFRERRDPSSALLSPLLAPAGRSRLTFSFRSLSPQAETPLSRTCRQNAPPVAGYHCPPRRSASAAVRLHDRQCECPAVSGGRRGRQCWGGRGGGGVASGRRFHLCPLYSSSRLHGYLQTRSLRRPRAFCSSWQSAPFQF